ncbi:MAG: hypothetical protein Fur003_2290 [Candidatus Dojkabacteria bacterium]
MSSSPDKSFWDNKLQGYAKQDFINMPSIFAKEIEHLIPPKSKILEIGAGLGQDAIYFTLQDNLVTATDFSDTAVDYLSKVKAEKNLNQMQVEQVDCSKKLPYKDKTFDIVYSHLGLHFFDSVTTSQLFNEVNRILVENGYFIFLANSTDDPEYNLSKKLEPDLFDLGDGNIKRFFSVNSVQEFIKSLFTVELLDNHSSSYKDNKVGVKSLIRFVGRKV